MNFFSNLFKNRERKPLLFEQAPAIETKSVQASMAPDFDPGFWRSSLQRNISPQEIIKRPYLYHAVTYGCVKTIALNVCRLKKLLHVHETESNEITQHPLLNLLEAPSVGVTQKTFFQLIILNLMLQSEKRDSGGQCFIVPWDAMKDKQVDLSSGAIPDNLFPFNDEYFEAWTEKIGDTGRVRQLGWKFEIPNNQKSKIYFKNNEIIRIHFVNPYNVLSGMSPLAAATISIDQDVNADLYNTRLFQNDARVSGVLSVEGQLTNTQRQENLKAWYSEYGGPGNAGRIAILGNGLKYQQIGLSNTDLQFKEQKLWNRDNVITTFGLNKIAIGEYEKINLATIREGRKILWTDTYIPIDECMLDAFNSQWIRFVDKGKYRIKSDYSRVEALSYDNREKLSTATELVNKAEVPFSVACGLLGIPLKDSILKKYPYLAEKPQIMQYKVTEADSDAQQNADNAEGDPTPKTPKEPKEPKKHIITVKPRGLFASDKERRDFSDAYIKSVLDKGEKSFKFDLDKYFIAQRNLIQDKIDAHYKTKSVISRALDFSSFLPDDEDEIKKLLAYLQSNSKKQAQWEKEQIEAELGNSIDWQATDKFISKFVDSRAEYAETINTNTFNVARDAIEATVKEGMDEGWTTPELAREIKAAVYKVYEVRLGHSPTANGNFDLGGMSSSRTIARTEMGSIASESRFAAFKDEGIEEWEWVTSHDEKVRDSHVELDGKHTDVGKEFPESDLKYPRDPDGDAEDVINCRCVSVMYTKD